MLYLIAALIGLSLGMIGAGGAIVAVPAFVYLGKIPPTLASGYALFIVSVASTVGSVGYVRQGLVHWRSVIAFGITTTVTISLIRRFVLPTLPQEFRVSHSLPVLSLDTVLMVAFALILLGAGWNMLRAPQPTSTQPPHIYRLSFYGFVIGIVSGFLGVGGGFLMTPALVLWAGLDMRSAVGTSLVLIAINSASGVVADLARGAVYDWPLVLTFTAITTVSILIGMSAGKRLPVNILKKIFGWVVIGIGIAVFVQELL